MSTIIPNSYQSPNIYVDRLMPLLTSDEYRVLSYFTRRILGFHKRQDRLSLSQLTNGLISKAGEHLDYGTGLSTNTNRACIHSLKQYGILIQVAENDPYCNEGACYALELDSDKIDFAGLQERRAKKQAKEVKRTTRARHISTLKREGAEDTPCCVTVPPPVTQHEGTDVTQYEGDPVRLQHKRQNRKPVGKPERAEQHTLPPAPHQVEERKPKSKRDPNLDHPAVQLYKEICHLNGNEIQRKQIVEEVANLEHWKATLTNWMLQGWKPTNVYGLLDSYRKSNTESSAPPPPTPESKKEQSSIELEIMYAPMDAVTRGEWLRLVSSSTTRQKYIDRWKAGERDLKAAA